MGYTDDLIQTMKETIKTIFERDKVMKILPLMIPKLKKRLPIETMFEMPTRAQKARLNKRLEEAIITETKLKKSQARGKLKSKKRYNRRRHTQHSGHGLRKDCEIKSFYLPNYLRKKRVNRYE